MLKAHPADADTGAADPPTETAPVDDTGSAGWRDTVRATARRARVWFRGFRRTRPFWGGLWMLLGGWWILRMSMVGWQVLFSAGLTGFGGWLAGGGLILCGVVAWVAPSQRFFAGLIGLLLAVASFIISNLGGFFVGMFLGIVGAAMTLSWGARKPRKRSASAAEASEPVSESVG